MNLPPVGLFVASACGVCLGSGVATAALRATNGVSWVRGRSRCDACSNLLSYAATVPLLSFVTASGRCRSCAAPIDRLHVAGELAGGLVALSALLCAPLSIALPVIGLGFVLIGASVFDARTQRLPDSLTALATILCLALSVSSGTASLLLGVASALILFLLLQTLRYGFFRLRGEQGLGFGDVKLASALTLWVGPEMCWALVLASLMGLLFVRVSRKGRSRIAFGPFLAVAGWSVGLAKIAVGTSTWL